MSIFVVGINHKTAPLSVREQVYFSTDKLPLYLQDLLNQGHAQEAVLLSTCNRSELYCEAEDIAPLRNWFLAQVPALQAEMNSYLYCYSDADAVAHIMQVACGLDSMILGEPQILGQMKTAFSESCAVSAVGALFHRLFQQVFSVAKEIRTATAIGACPVSVASAAVHFIKERFPDFARAKVMLIGAGDTAQLLIRYLKPQLTKPIILLNRSMERVSALSADVRSEVYGISELAYALSQADIVFSATGSALPIVSKTVVTEAMQVRPASPLILLDIAVPRDIEPAVGELSNVSLHCIDDLKIIIEKNRKGREHAAHKAHEMIYQQSKALIDELKSLDRVSHTIRAYRSQIEAICRTELIKAKQALHQGKNPSIVLDAFASAYTKKLLHAPCVQLRQAGAEGRFELLHYARQLFAISDKESEAYETIYTEET